MSDFQCFACSSKFSANEILIEHIAKNHKFTEKSFRCCEVDCRRSFLSIDSFKQHRRRLHKTDANIDRCQNVDFSSDLMNVPLNSDSDDVDDILSNLLLNRNAGRIESSDYLNFVDFDRDLNNSTVSVSEISNQPLDYSVELRTILVFFVSKLYSYADMARSRANDIINNVSEILTKEAELFQKVIENSSDLNDLKVLIANLKNTFKFLGDTEFKRRSYFQKQLKTYIPPEQIKLGERVEYVSENNKPESRSVRHKNSSAEFIPLREVLKRFFELPNVLSDTLKYLHYLQNTPVISNFVQGDFWKTKMNLECYQGKLVLPIFPYADEYENNNPLGTHKGITKCLAVYASVPCLPPHYVSKIENIFLFVLFNSLDYKVFENKIIFRRIIDELKYLHEEGVTIECNGEKNIIYFLSALWAGDNLGLNAILGFTRCFNNTVCCRMCLSHASEFSKIFHEGDCTLRTKENYAEGLILNDPKTTGIVEECVFNELFFSLCRKYFSRYNVRFFWWRVSI